jgi:vacuolar-type H+-ATPase subunit F/Vma7
MEILIIFYDIFKDIANKLFEEKKEFKEYGNTFLYGKNINENKSLKENTIKNYDIIIVMEDIIKKEEKKLQNLAEKLKKETNLNAIICTKDTKNFIILNFYSDDEKIHCLLICNEDQIFNEIINKVYKTYPNYNIRNNYFICNKSRVNEYKSLKENNIKNNNLIILIKYTQNCVNGVFVKVKKREEEYELDSLAKKLKEETNIDVIISAKDTKNIITLKFQSVDQNINYFVICNEDEIFNIVVNKIFEVKKVFKEYGNIFLCNSNTINEYKSLKENNLKNYDIIIVSR